MGRLFPKRFINIMNNLPKLQDLWDGLIGHNFYVFGRQVIPQLIYLLVSKPTSFTMVTHLNRSLRYGPESPGLELREDAEPAD